MKQSRYINSASYRRAQYAKWERLEYILGGLALTLSLLLIAGSIYVLGSVAV